MAKTSRNVSNRHEMCINAYSYRVIGRQMMLHVTVDTVD